MAIPASNGKTVLVTGVNGYIASVLGYHLLRKGYNLRGTTRSAASTKTLLSGPYEPFKERVAIYEVPDMKIDGAFDEAAKGVNGIFHTASPIDFSVVNYDQMVNPAVKGVETVLSSALRAGPQLSSVVVTASVATLIDSLEREHTVTEADHASLAFDRAVGDRDEGKTTPSNILYPASKIAAERAVWKFREERKPSFAITTIHPSVVIGPPVVLPASPSKINETLQFVWGFFSGTIKTIGPNFGSGSFIDVRDVAFGHIWAFEHAQKADGERYILSSSFGPKQGMVDILRDAYKGTEQESKIPKGEPGKGYEGYNAETGKVDFLGYPPGRVRVSGEKAHREMGLEYITFQQSVVDSAKALEPLLEML